MSQPARGVGGRLLKARHAMWVQAGLAIGPNCHVLTSAQATRARSPWPLPAMRPSTSLHTRRCYGVARARHRPVCPNDVEALAAPEDMESTELTLESPEVKSPSGSGKKTMLAWRDAMARSMRPAIENSAPRSTFEKHF
mmetsp:Transcript_60651/g.161168  ORF Transcript_60651/g.161168 Transcript_60651/m.161168 type:complete len:139 (+) Transcript_60651:203-619(+)